MASVIEKQKVAGDALLPHQGHGAPGQALSRQHRGGPAALSHPARHMPCQQPSTKTWPCWARGRTTLATLQGPHGCVRSGQWGAGWHKWRPS